MALSIQEIENAQSSTVSIVPLVRQQKIIRLFSCKFDDLPHIPLETVLECLDDDEYGDGRLFSLVFRDLCAYDFLEKVWYMWMGHYWIRDDAQSVYHLVSGFLSSIYIRASAEINLLIQSTTRKSNEDDNVSSFQQKKLKAQKAALLARANDLKKISRVRCILEYARSDRSLHVPHQRTGREVRIAWDRNPWLLGTRNGVINLQTGELQDGVPGQFIRTIIPGEWRGLQEPCPRFEQFLQEIFADRDPKNKTELIHFLHKILGYGVTGLHLNHLFLALIGEQGRNGKDTLMNCLLSALGESLSGPISKEVMISSKFGSSPGAAKPHLMSLQGKRYAWCEETDKGESFSVGQVKDITGSKTLRGRGLHENEQTFDATFLLMLLTNNPPHADAQDKAFWERICPIMFNVRFVDNPDPSNPLEHRPDKTLGELLAKETSGILAWLVRGCLLWQKEGLDIPHEVLKERANYRMHEDTIGRFIAEVCITRKECKETGSSLYGAYRAWAEDNGLKPLSNPTFGKDIAKRFEKKNYRHVATYLGVGLRTNAAYELYVTQADDRAEEEEQKDIHLVTPVPTTPISKDAAETQETVPDEHDTLHPLHTEEEVQEMQSVQQFLTKCTARGVIVKLGHDGIEVEAQDNTLIEKVRAYVARHEIAVINVLTAQIVVPESVGETPTDTPATEEIVTTTFGTLCEICHFNEATRIWRAGKKYCSSCKEKAEKETDTRNNARLSSISISPHVEVVPNF